MPARLTASQWLTCCGAIALVAGCGVDDRSLSAEPASTAGRGGAGSGGRATTLPRPAEGGAGGAGDEIAMPLCVYNGSVESECETLVSNAGFGTDIKGWEPEDGIFNSWLKEDASASDVSGSLAVLNLLHGEDPGVAFGASRQCLPATGGRIYDLAGDVFIEEGQGDGLEGGPYEGSAMLGVFFFDEPDCVGSSTASLDSDLTTEVGKWVHISVSGSAPEYAASLRVRLNTNKPIRQYSFKAAFDNVFVRER